MQSPDFPPRVARLAIGFLIVLALRAAHAQRSDESLAKPSVNNKTVSAESLSEWPYFDEVSLPAQLDSPWVDFILPSAIFDKARYDLQDLRLYTGDGKEVPYALRVRTEKFYREPFTVRLFNRTKGPDGASEVSLDLGHSDLEHNEIEIKLPGTNYRRRVELEGSDDDSSSWRPVHEQDLISFRRGAKLLRDESISYPPSRYRYLRLRVFRDHQVDKEPVEISDVAVLRKVEIPGEVLSLVATIGPRRPVPGDGGPGSAWIFTLGGVQTPVTEIHVRISDRDFVRNFHVEAGGPPDTGPPFTKVASGVWQRRAEQVPKPMIASFAETRAARLQLVVTDDRNPPLHVQRVTYSAPARQLVFATPKSRHPLRLYFGNPNAERAQYDFARNLPERLEPKPTRATLGPRKENPSYVPKQLPWSERWPWLIYVVLTTVIIVLAAILVNLSRAAIRMYDELLTNGQPSAR